MKKVIVMSKVSSKVLGLVPAVLIGLGALVGCSSSDDNAQGKNDTTSDPVTVPGQAGSHVAVHGMVLFGKDKLYVSHIPIFQNPHNLQVVAEIKIASGVPEASQVFVDKLYTIRPNPFSLWDLAHGTLTSITGTIFTGSFEQGGRPIFANVKFDVSNVIYESGLAPNTPASPTLDYLAVGTPADPYLVHIIDAPNSFDQVTGIRLPQGSELNADNLSKGQLVSVDGGINSLTKRLAPGSVVNATLKTEGKDGEIKATQLQARGEFYCSKGPDFFQFCQPLAPVSPTP
jgi:hypothetical protein